VGRLLLLLSLLLLLAGCGHRQLKVNEPEGSDLFILQNNEPVPLTAGKDIVLLKPIPFTIVTRHTQVALSLAESPFTFPFVATGIDTAAEQRSPFYVWRAYPKDRRADYLVIGPEGHTLLTPDNGLRPVREGLYAFTVQEFYDAVRQRPRRVADLKAPLKAAVWIDRNRDLVMDEGELRLLELVFTSPQTAPF
jgi:hypothetical protein